MSTALQKAAEQGLEGWPDDIEKALSYAYLRLMDYTQKAAAEAVGMGERTGRRWESMDWWHVISAEAQDRWLNGLKRIARRSLAKHAVTDGALALKILERTDPNLAPPSVRQELTGAGGGAVEFVFKQVIIDPRDDDDE